MADDLDSNLHQLFPLRGQRPIFQILRQGKRLHEVAQIVGQGVKLRSGSTAAAAAPVPDMARRRAKRGVRRKRGNAAEGGKLFAIRGVAAAPATGTAVAGRAPSMALKNEGRAVQPGRQAPSERERAEAIAIEAEIGVQRIARPGGIARIHRLPDRTADALAHRAPRPGATHIPSTGGSKNTKSDASRSSTSMSPAPPGVCSNRMVPPP